MVGSWLALRRPWIPDLVPWKRNQTNQTNKQPEHFPYCRTGWVGGTQPECGHHKLSLMKVRGHARKFKILCLRGD